ncbi:MAG: hypothetical protein LBF22_06330 [Deltaproteobacteria bacterium]|jgi:hypothetical protein|nr:hypothetical protein [Deltaproteobacteria bacterium]
MEKALPDFGTKLAYLFDFCLCRLSTISTNEQLGLFILSRPEHLGRVIALSKLALLKVPPRTCSLSQSGGFRLQTLAFSTMRLKGIIGMVE